jgi:hypothetical protein
MSAVCHPERSARKELPTRFFCGSGGREVEGSLYLQETTVSPSGTTGRLGLLATIGFLRLLGRRGDLVAQDDTRQEISCAHE